MAVIYVDNKSYEVETGNSLLTTCLSLGLNVPYFCWHPAMQSVGACRQCAVKHFHDEHDTRGRIVMACMSDTKDGMRISIDDPEVKQFRASVIEFLMANHPHDCPVCDEGGECHLQDMTVLTGHVRRTYRFPKRTYQNQNMGPFVNHELNRCIQCYRCVRFYREYAGGHDLDVFGIHDRIYFGRFTDGTLENEFSGNLVEICPTGVFTDKTARSHFTRKWDLQTAPSVCVHCSVGCNTIPGERYGTLRRIRNRFNYEVNGYFLCDRGRYGYEFVNRDSRLRYPLLKNVAGGYAGASLEKATHRLRDMLGMGAGVIGIGSPRASLETNYVLQRFVGPENFYDGHSIEDYRTTKLILDIVRAAEPPVATLHEVARCDAVFILGEDVANTAPIMALALRQSVRQKQYAFTDKLDVPRWNDGGVRQAGAFDTGPFHIATYNKTRLDDIATSVFRAAPADLARFGAAVADAIQKGAEEDQPSENDIDIRAAQVARDLMEAERPLIVFGSGSGEVSIIHSALAVTRNLMAMGKKPQIAPVPPHCNSLGLLSLTGQSIEQALERLYADEVKSLLIVENDLYRVLTVEEAECALDKAAGVVAFDHTSTKTSGAADVTLPVGSFAEASGTYINYEGRCQRFFRVMSPLPENTDPWRRLLDIAKIIIAEAEPASLDLSAKSRWTKLAELNTLDDIVDALVADYPELQAVKDCAPSAAFRIDGMQVARQPQRYSGRTSMLADQTVHEPKPPIDVDSPLNFSMEGYHGEPPAEIIPRFWAPHWNSVQSLNKFQAEVGGPIKNQTPGKRIIAPRRSVGIPEAPPLPEAFTSRTGEWLVVPLYEIFGSEELSVLSPPVRERSPKPYIAISPSDAKKLRLLQGAAVTVSLGDIAVSVEVRLSPDLADGLLGLPLGLPRIPFVHLPAWGTIATGPSPQEAS